jgi:hypothetical protein
MHKLLSREYFRPLLAGISHIFWDRRYVTYRVALRCSLDLQVTSADLGA